MIKLIKRLLGITPNKPYTIIDGHINGGISFQLTFNVDTNVDAHGKLQVGISGLYMSSKSILGSTFLSNATDNVIRGLMLAILDGCVHVVPTIKLSKTVSNNDNATPNADNKISFN